MQCCTQQLRGLGLGSPFFWLEMQKRSGPGLLNHPGEGAARTDISDVIEKLNFFAAKKSAATC